MSDLGAEIKEVKTGEEAIDYAMAIKVEALRQLGMMLKGTERNVGARGIGKSVVPKENCTPPTLSELGIDRKISSLSQKITAKQIKNNILEKAEKLNA